MPWQSSRFALLLSAILLSSCSGGPRDDSPAVVRFDYLVQAYSIDPTNAAIAYDDRVVYVPITTYTVKGDTILVHAGLLSEPAVLMFEFQEPQSAKGVIWIKGVCKGRKWDGKPKGAKAFKFHILVTDCQVVPPPTMPTF